MWKKLCAVLLALNCVALGVLIGMNANSHTAALFAPQAAATQDASRAEETPLADEAPSDADAQTPPIETPSPAVTVLSGSLTHAASFDSDKTYGLLIRDKKAKYDLTRHDYGGFSIETKAGEAIGASMGTFVYWKDEAVLSYSTVFAKVFEAGRNADASFAGDLALGLEQETAGFTRSQAAERAAALVDELLSDTLFTSEVTRVYAYTAQQLENLCSEHGYNIALSNLGTGDGLLYAILLRLRIGDVPVYSEDADGTIANAWQDNKISANTVSAVVTMTADELLMLELYSIYEPTAQLQEAQALTRQEIAERHSLQSDQALHVDASALDCAALQYIAIQSGYGAQAQVLLTPVWRFARTDGEPVFFDAVSGEHIAELDARYPAK